MLVWANAHGGFLAGLGAIGLAILLVVSVNLTNGRRGIALLDGTRPLWFVLAACAAVSFANPRGVRLWQYVMTEMLHDTNRRFVSEWRPAHASGDMWSLISLTVITVTVAVLGCLARGENPIAPLRAAGKRVDCWTLDADHAHVVDKLAALIAAGADQITTNDPEVLGQLWNRHVAG